MSNIDELAAMLNENAEVARNDGCPLTAGQYEAAAEALVSMAEALQMLVASVSSSDEIGNADLHEAVEAARAALAKARGEQG